MRRPKKLPPKPPLQDLERIEHRVAKLGAAGWLKELTAIYKWSVMHDLGLHRPHPTIHVATHGSDIISAPWPTVQPVELRDRDRIIPKGTKFWNGPKLRRNLRIPKEAPFELPRERLPVLIVSLDAPDAVILEAVQRELKKARKRYPAPVIKPGKRALNGRFDATTFKQYRRAKIVQLAALFVWRSKLSVEDRKCWPDHRLGREIGLEEPKDVTAAKNMLLKALASIPPLTSQIISQSELLPSISECKDDDERLD